MLDIYSNQYFTRKIIGHVYVELLLRRSLG